MPDNNNFVLKPIAIAISLASSGLVPVVVAEERSAIEEVVVTATRRATSVQDIPYNISAVSGEQIEDAGVTDIADLSRFVPGISYADLGARNSGVNSQIVLRGLRGDPVGVGGIVPSIAPATVSTYVGETPIFADIKLADMKRVEVLRGPQGTIYGANSLGGTLRFIPNDPELAAQSFSLRSSVSDTAKSDDLNYSVDGVANLPLSEKVGVRVAAGFEDIAGVIDQTNLPVFEAADNPAGFGVPAAADPTDLANSPFLVGAVQEDVDTSESWYTRASLLWEASESTDVMLRVFHQDDEFGGQSGQLFGGTADAENQRPVVEPMTREIDIYSADISVDLGFATLTSSSAYWQNEFDSEADVTGLIENLSSLYGGFPRITSPQTLRSDIKSFTQEIRFVSQGDGPLSWTAGAFYLDRSQDSSGEEYIPGYKAWSELTHPTAEFYLGAGASWADLTEAFGQGRPAAKPNAFFFDRQVEINEVSVFGEASYAISEAWQVTFGVRAFRNEQEMDLFTGLPYCGAFCAADGASALGDARASVSQDVSDQIYKVNSSYDIDENTMVYFTWSEGFRRGGANAFPLEPATFGESASLIPFDSDTATNFEVGIKGYLLDGSLRYSLAAYRIDWDDPQINTFTDPGGFSIVINGDEAETKGLELELQAEVTERLGLTFGYGYTDAELTSDFSIEAVAGFAGDKLPGIPEHQVTVGANYHIALSSGNDLDLRLDGFYRDEVTTALNSAVSNFGRLDSYSMWNASINWSSQKWGVTLFAKNLGNEEGLSGIFTQSQTPATSLEFITRPRTIGLVVSYDLE